MGDPASIHVSPGPPRNAGEPIARAPETGPSLKFSRGIVTANKGTRDRDAMPEADGQALHEERTLQAVAEEIIKFTLGLDT